MKLLALLFAYTISHFVSKPERFRNFNWFKSWSVWFRNKTKFTMSEFTVILIIGIPIVIVVLILANITTSIIGGLLVAMLVLSYCIGPKNFEEDIESEDFRKRIGLRKNAKIPLLIKKMTQVSLNRWFGVFFWYVVLGIVGALMYRLCERLDFFTKGDDELKEVVTRVMKILNYPVAWMMVISLAIASDFERIYKKCKPFLKYENIVKMDDSFLYDATDFAVENCEVESEDKKSIEQVTYSVLIRMMVVWLVIVSVLVIFAV